MNGYDDRRLTARIHDGHAMLESAARGPHYGKGPKGYKRSDQRILEDVSDRIAEDGWMDASDVEVSVAGGIVTLRGAVVSRTDKRRIEQLIVNVYGVDDIHNELRVSRTDSVLDGFDAAPGIERGSVDEWGIATDRGEEGVR